VSDKLWHALNESECEQSKPGNGDDCEEAPARTAAKTQAKVRQILADALDAVQTFRGDVASPAGQAMVTSSPVSTTKPTGLPLFIRTRSPRVRGMRRLAPVHLVSKRKPKTGSATATRTTIRAQLTGCS
jgi:hypothetical protein